MYTSSRRIARRAILIAAVLVAAFTFPAMAGDWANWRGPNNNGTTDEKNLPSKWSEKENIKWTAPLPGISSATPIISGDRVFVASNDETKQKLFALCLTGSQAPAYGANNWRRRNGFRSGPACVLRLPSPMGNWSISCMALPTCSRWISTAMIESPRR